MYQVYMTDGMKAILDTISGFAGCAASNTRFYDLLWKNSQTDQTKDGDTIALDVIQRAGLVVNLDGSI